MLATMFMFLRGTPFIYQGQEIGMTNIRMDSIEDYDDIQTIDQYKRALQNGISEEVAWESIYRKSRDNGRTPMQWNDSKNAGFTTAESTWLKVNSNYKEINVEKSRAEKQSVFKYYQKLIQLRKEGKYKELLVDGLFVADKAEDPCVMAYRRDTEKESLIVYLNYQDQETNAIVPEGYTEKIIGNYEDGSIVDGVYHLRPYECISFYKK